MCAAVAIGEYSTLQDAAEKFVKIADTLEPNLSNHQIYQNAYNNYQLSYNLLSKNDIFNKLQGNKITG
jgi:sugar (pentulose or hexulose) kinase